MFDGKTFDLTLFPTLEDALELVAEAADAAFAAATAKFLADWCEQSLPVEDAIPIVDRQTAEFITEAKPALLARWRDELGPIYAATTTAQRIN